MDIFKLRTGLSACLGIKYKGNGTGGTGGEPKSKKRIRGNDGQGMGQAMGQGKGKGTLEQRDGTLSRKQLDPTVDVYSSPTLDRFACEFSRHPDRIEIE